MSGSFKRRGSFESENSSIDGGKRDWWRHGEEKNSRHLSELFGSGAVFDVSRADSCAKISVVIFRRKLVISESRLCESWWFFFLASRRISGTSRFGVRNRFSLAVASFTELSNLKGWLYKLFPWLRKFRALMKSRMIFVSH